MITTTLMPNPHLVVFGRDTAGKPHASWFDQASAELATKAAGLMNMHAVPVEGDALRELAVTLPKGRVFSSGRAFTPFVAGKLYSRLVELTRDALGLGEGEAEKTGAAPPRPAKAQPKLQVVKTKHEGDSAAIDRKVPAEATPTAPADAPAPPSAPVGDATAKVAPAASIAAVAALATAATPVAAVTPAAGLSLVAPSKGVARPSRAEEVGIGSMVLASTGPMEGWWEAEVIGSNGSMLTLRWRDFAEPTVVRRRADLAFLPAVAG